MKFFTFLLSCCFIVIFYKSSLQFLNFKRSAIKLKKRKALSFVRQLKSILFLTIFSLLFTQQNFAQTVNLGDATLESGTGTRASNNIEAWDQFTTTAPYNITSFVMYQNATGGTGTMHVGLYTDNGSGTPSTLVPGSDGGAITISSSTGWITYTIPNFTLPAGTYWIGFTFSANNPSNWNRKAATGVQWYKLAVGYAALTNWPTTGSSSDVNGPLSMYFTGVPVCTTPTAFSVTGGGGYCSGGSGVPVGLANSQSNVNYQLYNGASTVGSPVAGTGSAISFGNQTTATTFTVVATTATGGCTNNMTGSATVTVNPTPTGTLSNGGAICSGTQPQLTFTKTAGTGTTFTLVINGQTYSSVTSGTAFMATGTAPTGNTTYTLSSVSDGTCTNSSPTGSTPVTVNPTPTGTLSNGGAVCSGTQPQLTFSKTAGTGTTFTLVINGQTYNSITSGTAFTAIGTAPTGNTTYTLSSVSDGTCTNSSPTGSTPVTVNPTPTGTLSNGGAVCSGTQPQLIFTKTAGTGTTFTLVINGQTYNSITSGTAFTATGIVPTSTTTYIISSISDGTCSNPSPTGSTSVTINPLPSSSVTGQSNITCYGSSNGTITITASGGTSPYSYSVNNGTSFIPSASNPYTYTGLVANNAYQILVKDSNGCISK